MSMGAVTSPLGTSSSEDPQGRISPVYEARDKSPGCMEAL